MIKSLRRPLEVAIVNTRPSAIPIRCDIFKRPLEINFIVCGGKRPWLEAKFGHVLYDIGNLEPEYRIEHILGFGRSHLDLFDVGKNGFVDDVVGEYNLLEGLRSSHDNLARAEDADRDLFHVTGRLELDLDGRVPVWIKTDVEHWFFTEMVGYLDKVDMVIQAEVGVDHDDPKTVNWDIVSGTQCHLQNKRQLFDDAIAVEQVGAAGHLDTAIGEQLDGFGTVLVPIIEGNLVVKSCFLQAPLKPTVLGVFHADTDRLELLKDITDLVNVDIFQG